MFSKSAHNPISFGPLTVFLLLCASRLLLPLSWEKRKAVSRHARSHSSEGHREASRGTTFFWFFHFLEVSRGRFGRKVRGETREATRADTDSWRHTAWWSSDVTVRLVIVSTSADSLERKGWLTRDTEKQGSSWDWSLSHARGLRYYFDPRIPCPAYLVLCIGSRNPANTTTHSFIIIIELTVQWT